MPDASFLDVDGFLSAVVAIMGVLYLAVGLAVGLVRRGETEIPADGQWHQIALVVTDAGRTVYVDGERR